MMRYAESLNLFLIKTLVQHNTQFLELCAHGRVNMLVTACHGMAGLPGKGGYSAHKCAANSQYVYVHGQYSLLVWVFCIINSWN